jgi:pyruvate/2-oxoglutarate dehydrogenase complex dihydrolipoamide dehydrogenase (E3) component
MYDYDLVVIGGGSGGLVAARLAHNFGAKVALIEKERLGGDCLHYGCVPSKTLIHIAKVAHTIRQGAALGVLAAAPEVAMPRVAATIAGVIDQISADEQIYVEGVDVRFGQAVFTDGHTLTIAGTPITSKSFLIATGSRPALPALPGLSEAGFLTNQDVFDLDHLPASLVVMGGGPVGCELSQAFARLGSQVTLLQRHERLLPKEEPEVSQAIAEVLSADGVRIILGAQPQQVALQRQERVVTFRDAHGAPATVSAEGLLVAVGRQPNIADLGLDHAGVQTNKQGIIVDAKMRTSTAHIFAIGDVIGGYQFTHVAAAQAGIAVPNAFLPRLIARTMKYDVVPWATFTDPEAARVGLTEAEARQRFGDAIHSETMPYAGIDRAQTDGATTGFIKLILNKKDAILGAHIVGARAGEVLAEITLAMRHHLGVNEIIATIHAYPTYATGLQQTAFEAYLKGSKFAGARAIIQRFLPKR